MFALIFIDIEYRLVGGGNSSNTGRLEMRVGDEWGTFCLRNSYTSALKQNAQNMFCRALNFTSSEKLLYASKGEIEPGNGQVWTYYVHCGRPDYNSIVQCSTYRLGAPIVYSYCSGHKYDVGLICK